MLIPYNLETDKIKAKIFNDSAEGKAQIEFLQKVITEYYASDDYQELLTSQRYYDNKNDIIDAKRTVIGRNSKGEPTLMESHVLANNKLVHNFYKKLVRQKIAYMLSRPFILKASKAEDNLTEKFIEKFTDEYDLDFHKMLKNVGRDSIIKRLGWLQVYYDEEGILRFKRIPPEEVIPIWEDDDHTKLASLIRKYQIQAFDGANYEYVTYVEYYTKEAVYYYKLEKDSIAIDYDKGDNGVGANFIALHKDENGVDVEEGQMWDKIPFIPFKYDPDEKTLLVRVKSLIDEYDKKQSGIANQIDDIPNSVLVVKNYDGKSKEEFTHNKNQYRTIFVQGDGDAKALETPLDIEGLDKHLERVRQDIYEFGQGVNTSNKDIRDTSGVALRFMYSDLDMDCSDWSCELEWSLKLLIWFKQQDLLMREGVDYSQCKYDIVFDTDVIVNETETIQNCFTSQGVISDETVASNHPWTRNAKKEVESMHDDMETELDLEATYKSKVTKDSDGQRTPNPLT